jgi:hypothetical protein
VRDSRYSSIRLMVAAQTLLIVLAAALGCFNGSVDLGAGVDHGSGVCMLKVLQAAQAVAGSHRYAVILIRSGWEGRLDYFVGDRETLVDTSTTFVFLPQPTPRLRFQGRVRRSSLHRILHRRSLSAEL